MNNNKIDIKPVNKNKPQNTKGGKQKSKGGEYRTKYTSDADLNYKPQSHSKPSGDKGKADHTYPGNDIDWYRRVPNLLDTAKQVVFNIPHGTRLQSTSRPVAGVIALDYCPIIGYCEPNEKGTHIYASETEFYDVWAATPFNVAVRNSYSKVRSSKGGSRPYDYPDMAHMLLSAATIFAYIVHLQRVLRCVNRFNFENKYLGQALVGMFGYSYDDLVTNYIAYIGRLNMLVEKATSVAVPADIAVINEWLWRNSNIFKDTNTDNIKQQYIVDVPNGFYVYDEANGDANYEAHTIRSSVYESVNHLNMSDVLSSLEVAISKLWNSETFAILMGDIRYAYNNRVMTIPQMAINESIEPVWNLEHAIGVQNMNYIHTRFDTPTILSTSAILTDEDLSIALSVHQDLRSAALNNGAVYAGLAYSDDAASRLRGYKIHLGLMKGTDVSYINAFLQIWEMTTMSKCSFINTYSDVPDGDVIVYATRMKMVSRFCNNEGGVEFDEGNRDLWYQITSTTCCLWLGPRILITPNPTTYDPYMTGNVVEVQFTGTIGYTYPEHFIALSTFNIAPKAMIVHTDANYPADRSYITLLGDVSVGTDIYNTALMNLQAVCLYSQWLIPDTIDQSGFTPRVLTK